jgi:hypothetical protein
MEQVLPSLVVEIKDSPLLILRKSSLAYDPEPVQSIFVLHNFFFTSNILLCFNLLIGLQICSVLIGLHNFLSSIS